jgi:hypothetical protein
MRPCPLCLRPLALERCCELGKKPLIDWTLDDLKIFLDMVREPTHRWKKFGGLGEVVDAPLSEQGYKAIFEKERLTGKLMHGKQRKTLADMLKRFGVKNVKHRDLMAEAFVDLSKPQPQLSDEQLMEEKFILVRNTWSAEKQPDIQIAALADVMRESASEDKHQLLKKMDVTTLLFEIMSGPMTDESKEEELAKRQVCVCVCVCMHVCIVYIYMSGPMTDESKEEELAKGQVHVNVCVRMCMCVCVCVCVCIYICMYVCMNIFMCTCVCIVHTQTCARTFTHTYTHTHAHTHTRTHSNAFRTHTTRAKQTWRFCVNLNNKTFHRM